VPGAGDGALAGRRFEPTGKGFEEIEGEILNKLDKSLVG
jgi:hypothetical protein